MRIIITGACGHIGSYIAENVHKIKKVKNTILIKVVFLTALFLI